MQRRPPVSRNTQARARCATHLLDHGVDIRVIQVLPGHARLENIALYTLVATRTLRTVTSPFDEIVAMIEEPASASG